MIMLGSSYIAYITSIPLSQGGGVDLDDDDSFKLAPIVEVENRRMKSALTITQLFQYVGPERFSPVKRGVDEAVHARDDLH